MHKMTAPRPLSPGEVIGKEAPFIHLLQRAFKDDACESCFERTPNLKSCQGCLSIKYCSKSCQKKDWKNHRLECKNLKNLPSVGNVDLTRIIGNIIMKIKDKDWKTIKINILGGRGVTFDDIEQNFERTPKTHRHVLYSSVKECVRRYIGDENMPNEDAFGIIFRKVQQCICVGVIEAYQICTMYMLTGLSFSQRECIPNCQIVLGRNDYTVFAIKKIEQSEKLSFFTTDILNDGLALERFTAPCSCTDCKLPYGESVLSKITDEHKAFSVVTRSEDLINMWHSFPNLHGTTVMECMVDDVLRMQEGVLGDTHALRLKLLVIKCFHTGGDPLEKKRNLLKLEKNVVAVFGEYYEELPRIYRALSDVCFKLENLTEGFYYLEKLNRFVALMEPL